MEADTDAIAEFWARCVDAGAVPRGATCPTDVFAFGDGPAMADELAGLVIEGPKRATVAALAEFEHESVEPPRPGGLSIVLDGSARPRVLIRTTEVRVGPLDSVDDAFAWDEGEDDRTRDTWLAGHERFFRRFLPTIGATFDPRMPTVFERFEVLHAE